MNLYGKNVLIIAPRFFGYEKAICNEIVKQGGVCHYADDRVSKSIIFLVLLRAGLSFFLRPLIKRHFGNFLKLPCIDYILVISPEGLPRNFLVRARTVYPDAKLILYMWDSFLNKPKGLSYLCLFDSVFSFDKEDCVKFPGIKFRPLFFLPSPDGEGVSAAPEFDLVFAGSLHGDRYRVVEGVRRSANNIGIKSKVFYFFKDRFVLKLLKIFRAEFRDIDVSRVSDVALSSSQFRNFLLNSRAVLDVESDGQTGLTIRSLEVLSLRRKLVTTNSSIVDYDFFHEDNILVIDRQSPQLPLNFFKRPFVNLDSGVVDRYSLSSWIREVFS